MSFCEEFREFDLCDEKQLSLKVQAVADEERELYGSFCSGYWGSRGDLRIDVRSHAFKNDIDAHDYLSREIDRHGPLIAVKFYDMSLSEKQSKLQLDINKNNEAISKQMISVAKRIRKTAKTSYNGKQCGHCKSRWCDEYSKMDKCQLCHTVYWTAADKEKRNKLSEKKNKLLLAYLAESKLPVKIGTLKWMVAGVSPA